jgi:threonine dehydratase
MEIPDLSLVRAAAARIAPHAHRTPVLRSAFFDELLGGHLLFKCENFQKVGAFKFRGALNAVLSLTEEQAGRGVLTHSSGNHAQALALAAQIRGIAATIVMPRTSLPVKLAAVRGYGGRVVCCEPTQLAREETARAILEQTGASLIHPYDDPRIIAGQGTAALELLAQAEPLDLVLAPVGGGGLMSGTLIACASLAPAVQVIGVEPDGADDARRSLEVGRVLPSVDPRTIADGLLTSLSERTFAIIRQQIHAIVTASDEATIRAMRLVYERMKIVIEPSAAVPLAALLEGKLQLRGRRAGLILSGGNADLDALPWLPR